MRDIVHHIVHDLAQRIAMLEVEAAELEDALLRYGQSAADGDIGDHSQGLQHVWVGDSWASSDSPIAAEYMSGALLALLACLRALSHAVHTACAF